MNVASVDGDVKVVTVVYELVEVVDDVVVDVVDVVDEAELEVVEEPEPVLVEFRPI